MEVQLKKGVLEMCVLKVLEKKDCYGYELVSQISKRIAIAEGTIYPLLKRLKDDGFVETYLQESKEGPPRKYYQLTAEGKKQSKRLTKEWQDFAKKIEKFMER